MNKKKLSHSNLNSSITSVLAALLCIVIGYAASWLFPPPAQSLQGLTIHRQDAVAASG